jgi:uncharacterized protein (TIGR02594 family)
MPIFPRSERQTTVSGRPLPFSTGDGYEAPGKAQQKLGHSIEQLGSAVGDFLQGEQKKRDELDMFQTKFALEQFATDQGLKQREWDSSVKEDGRDHVTGRLAGYDQDFGKLVEGLPANAKARQQAQLYGQRLRGNFGEQSWVAADNHRQGYYLGQIGESVSRSVLPGVTGDLEKAQAALGQVDAMIDAAPGLNEQTRDKARRAAADAVFKQWASAAGANAHEQANQLAQSIRQKQFAAQYPTATDDMRAGEPGSIPPASGQSPARAPLPAQRVTAYSPQAAGSPTVGMEGGYKDARNGTVKTVDDYFDGKSGYVTIAGDPKFIGREYVIPRLGRIGPDGAVEYRENVRARVLDTGEAFKGAPEGRFDVPVRRDANDATMKAHDELWNRDGLQFIPTGRSVPQVRDLRGQPIDTSSGRPVDVAKAFLGASETRDAAPLAEFFRKAGGQKLSPADTAWCAAFVNAALGATGREGTGTLLARDFLKAGTATDQPSEGDIVVLRRNGPGGWEGHVGFYAGRDQSGNVLVLGGNQANGVSVAPFPASQVLGYRKPPDAGGALPGNQAPTPRTTSDYLVDQIIRARPQLEVKSAAALRKEQMENDKAFRQERLTTEREGLDRLAKGELTRAWVEENEGYLGDRSFEKLMRAVDPKIPRTTNPTVYSGLVGRANEDPDAVIREAGEAYAAGQLNSQGYREVHDLASRYLDRQKRPPQPVIDIRQQIKRALAPPDTASEDQRKAYADTLKKFDTAVLERNNGRDVDPKEFRALADQLVRDHKVGDADQARKSLPMPKGLTKERTQLSLDDIERQRQVLMRDLASKKITENEAFTESYKLLQWKQTLEQEMSARGQNLEGGPASPMGGKSAPAAPTKPATPKGPSQALPRVPVDEMQRKARDLAPDPALSVGAP